MDQSQLEMLVAEIESDNSLQEISLVPISAWYGHAPFLKYLIKKQKPEVFVELGTHFGFSYFTACEEISLSETRTKAFSVDTWLGDKHAGFFDDSVFEFVKNHNQKYEHFSKLIRCTFDEAVESFQDKSIDLLHIDGLHTYEAVKHDFYTWLPKLSPKAIVLIHDINLHREDFGVFKFWEEIKCKYPNFEFNHSFGLGIIVFNPQIQEPPINLLTSFTEIERNKFIGAIGTSVASFMGKLFQERNTQIDCNVLILAERDAALAERDAALAERNLILNSNIWRISKPYRYFKSELLRLFT